MNAPRCALFEALAPVAGAAQRFVGIDIGAETIKLVELLRERGRLRWVRRAVVAHEQEPRGRLELLLREWDWAGVAGAAVTGRLGRQLRLPHLPVKQAQIAGGRFLLGDAPVTIASIGSHGFSILELRGNGLEIFRENSRCSQGTGNFLRQLVGRFSLTIEEASRLCTAVEKPAVLSGRCPVILKTDMTHLANKGEDRAAILAGLFDAVCENVLVLIKPDLCPKRVALIGGVPCSARVQATFRERLASLGLELLPLPGDDGRYFEALGCAVVAASGLAAAEAEKNPPANGDARPPPLDNLFRAAEHAHLERVPALAAWRDRVRRMPAPPLAAVDAAPRPIVLGFDIGSTGSKAVAIDAATRETVWESYRATGGDPVGAAQALLRALAESPAGRGPIRGFGATGSGREIVGSLLTVCYGKEVVFVLNEIAAHAEGAQFFDPRVDTIFEIGGQDAKYIRLSDGRVTDCAMNEACSAGTGSFIEEQGRKFAGIRDVAHLAAEAMAAEEGVSLGQHCSVFMAEVIDEAVAAGTDRRAIIAGLYDSIVQNYLNRVKGSRSVGHVIFCQGMPFASDALAAAVARQTGAEVIVPPNPGTVGALGIALLAQRAFGAARADAATIEAGRFLGARVEGRDTFHCHASVGCGGAGNRCRIERLRTVVAGKTQGFTWGGGCALHDKGTRRKKLPDRAPDPFREREELVRELLARLAAVLDSNENTPGRSRPRIALTDEFALKGLFPFFATFLHGLGYELVVVNHGDQADLKRGIRGANVPFCAPMQLYHGIAARMVAAGASRVFLPMLCSLPPVADEKHAVACPIIQASPDLVRCDLAPAEKISVVAPIIKLGAGGVDSPEFLASCRALATSLGAVNGTWHEAHAAARRAQLEFEQRCFALGARALGFCAEHGIDPVVVMGRPYTIYNPVLNSNVPAILREQGAIGIPVDCYPVDATAPAFPDMYWGYGQRILRAAHQVRRTAGHYSLYCSNYACGPDSFNLHFYAHVMHGKPFAIIETDGHSGDAGTKTRVEAFLHCVAQDRAAQRSCADPPHDFSRVQTSTLALRDILARRERLLIPWMGDASEAVASCLRGRRIPAESLPPPGREELRLGRRHTSGKECLPIVLTLGGLLRRLERAEPAERFAYLMASTHGPCRFGVYNLLNQIVLQRLGWHDRVRIWSPRDTGYFDEFPPAFGMLVFTGIMAVDLLNDAALDAGSAEIRAGAADEIYRRRRGELCARLEACAAENLSTPAALWEVTSGRLFGVRDLLAEAAAEFAAARRRVEQPTVLLVGEIYVRCVPFANDCTAQKLQARGLRVRLAPVHEWLEYCDRMARRGTPWWQPGPHVSDRVQDRIRHTACAALDGPLDWPERHTANDMLAAARPYLSDQLEGEAVLTLGGPLLAWRHGQIDGVVSVGPHECMPNKIAESQFFHVAENEGLPSLTLPLNGDPADPEILDNFAFEMHTRFRQRRERRSHATARTSSRVAAAAVR
ncbi:MAG TPA: BadF/BadG/BcrA/BcrD ATPase family protein [Opitutaceae bacterium]|nr:BadF/BadG/BcrA/BcrD ATPase family protein [Opitutaceae bacterium]